jgi:hypothetical protein
MPELQLLPPQGGVFFREQDHRYFYLGQRAVEVPSSSHIIKLSGGKDFPKEQWHKSLLRKGLSDYGAEYFMERVRDIRAAIGTEAHALIAHRGLGVLDECTKGGASGEAETIYALWLEHVHPRIGKVYVIERPMIHPGGCYGFTPDLVAEVDGILSLCDWKSNQAKDYEVQYDMLTSYAPDDKILKGICDHLAKVDKEAKRTPKETARVRDGWQMQQGSYVFGLEAVCGLRIERGINFMLSVDGVKEHRWNRPDLEQGWLQFAGGLLLHHQRAVMSGGDPVFGAALNALYPLMHG